MGLLPDLTLEMLATGFVGALLIWLGLRTWRRGDTPHCDLCGYNLTGLTAADCPECGCPIRPECILRGEPFRRYRLAAVGAVFVAVSALWFTGAIHRHDWYQYSPLNTVLVDLHAEAALASDRAWGELSRRIKSGKLSDDDCSKLTADGLHTMRRGDPLSPNEERLHAVLLKWFDEGRLTKAEKAEFCQHLLRVKLKIRRRAGLGRRVPYAIAIQGLYPGPRVTLNGPLTIKMDGSEVYQMHPSWSPQASGTFHESLSTPSRGEHALELDYQATVREAVVDETIPGKEIAHCNYHAKAQFEVIDAPPEATITMVGSLDESRRLLESIRIKVLTIGPDENSCRDVRVTKRTFEWPRAIVEQLACEVLIEFGNTQYSIGELLYDGEFQGKLWALCEYHGSEVPTCTVILRGSKRVAARTLNIDQIIPGDVRWENVPILWERPAQPGDNSSPSTSHRYYPWP